MRQINNVSSGIDHYDLIIQYLLSQKHADGYSGKDFYFPRNIGDGNKFPLKINISGLRNQYTLFRSISFFFIRKGRGVYIRVIPIVTKSSKET